MRVKKVGGFSGAVDFLLCGAVYVVRELGRSNGPSEFGGGDRGRTGLAAEYKFEFRSWLESMGRSGAGPYGVRRAAIISQVVAWVILARILHHFGAQGTL